VSGTCARATGPHAEASNQKSGPGAQPGAEPAPETPPPSGARAIPTQFSKRAGAELPEPTPVGEWLGSPRLGGSAPGRLVIAGFDAGQTHTRCRLADPSSGRILVEGEGPGVSHLAAAAGPERFRQALRQSLAEAYQQRPGLEASVAAAAIGASGIEQGSSVQGQGVELAAEALGLPRERVAVTGDERTALRGAFPDGPGVVVISGTGTIAVGRDGAGREHRCGGWGWLLDGAGSALDIGRDGLSLSLEMADGRRPDSPLRPSLWQALGLEPEAEDAPQRLKALVVDPGFGPAGFARLAPVVERLAQQGDGQALEILERSARALAAMAKAVAGQLRLEAPPVCAMGGAIEHLPRFQRCFQRELVECLPTARLVKPRGDALFGALALALERLESPAG
jgi:glucosamine kinase